MWTLLIAFTSCSFFWALAVQISPYLSGLAATELNNNSTHRGGHIHTHAHLISDPCWSWGLFSEERSGGCLRMKCRVRCRAKPYKEHCATFTMPIYCPFSSFCCSPLRPWFTKDFYASWFTLRVYTWMKKHVWFVFGLMNMQVGVLLPEGEMYRAELMHFDSSCMHNAIYEAWKSLWGQRFCTQITVTEGRY